MRRDWLIFDLDDTLLGVQTEAGIAPVGAAYDTVLAKFANRLAAELGIHTGAALIEQKRLDVKLCEQYGFDSLDRFPMSLEGAYLKVAGPRSDRAVSQEIRDLGYSVYDFQHVAFDGVPEMLDALSSDYDIAIVTKGERDMQRKKLVQSGLIGYYDELFVVGRKDHADWIKILMQLGLVTYDQPNGSWAIGNSLRSDVNIPVQYGLNGIFLDGYSWAFEDAQPAQPFLGKQLLTVTDIREVENLIPLNANAA